MADLGRWLSGEYRVPGTPPDDSPDETRQSADAPDQDE